MRLEVCCGSYEDVVVAIENGADRIELNSALYLGGLTPSFATLQESLKIAKVKQVPVIAMIRPRGAGFHYHEAECKIMFADAKIFLEAGVDGLAFGFLNNNRTIDIELTKQMVQLIHSYQKEAVFHRAFDCVDDLETAIQQLIDCGVDRVLTSGGQASAPLGIETLKYLQAQYGNQIEILPGCGINASNAASIISATKVQQVHSSCKDYQSDVTTSGAYVHYAYYTKDHFNDYECVDGTKVKAVKSVLLKLNK